MVRAGGLTRPLQAALLERSKCLEGRALPTQRLYRAAALRRDAPSELRFTRGHLEPAARFLAMVP